MYMKKAFVTGATGFVGGHLIKELLKEGLDVVGLGHDYKPQTTLSLLGLDKEITLIYGDLRNRSLMKRILASYGIDTIFHLGAQAIVSVAQKDPTSTYEINCVGTANLLEACKEVRGVNSILIASTDKVYGEGLSRKETDPLNGIGIYETSKIIMELTARGFQKIYNLPLVISRACNIYGEYDSNRRIVPNTIRDLKKGEQPLIFVGEKSLREYVYVDDVCDAYVLLAKEIERSSGDVFNVGSGYSIGQEEMVKKIIDISRTNIEPKYVEKPGIKEIFRQTINSGKIKESFGWNPRYSLNDGLKKTWGNWTKPTY